MRRLRLDGRPPPCDTDLFDPEDGSERRRLSSPSSPTAMRRFALAVAAAVLAYLYYRSREQTMPSVDRPTSERRAFWLFGTPISEHIGL